MKRLVVVLVLILMLIIATFYILDFYKKPLDIPIKETEIPVVIDTLPLQEGLPPQVESKRQAIYTAARSRDYEKLNNEKSENFYYSYGGEYEGGFIGYLKLAEINEGESVFDIIPTLLRLPYTKKDNLYTWPSVFSIESSKWTALDIAMMKTFLTEKDIESYREYGGYIYYRLGITDEGKWTFYLAGD